MPLQLYRGFSQASAWAIAILNKSLFKAQASAWEKCLRPFGRTISHAWNRAMWCVWSIPNQSGRVSCRPWTPLLLYGSEFLLMSLTWGVLRLKECPGISSDYLWFGPFNTAAKNIFLWEIQSKNEASKVLYGFAREGGNPLSAFFMSQNFQLYTQILD